MATVEIHKPNYEQLLTKLENKTMLYDPNFQFEDMTSIFKEPQDQTLPMRERGIKFFSGIYGNDDIKDTLYRMLDRLEFSQNAILVGPPSSGKTIYLKAILRQCNNVVFHNAAASTDAGLINKLQNNKGTKLLLIDEVTAQKNSKNKTDLEVFRGLMDDGKLSKTTFNKSIDLDLEGLKIIMTTNNPKALSLPIKDRCNMLFVKPYSQEEFLKVLVFCLVDQGIIKNVDLAIGIAHAMQHYQIKTIRSALKIAKLINEDSDSKDDIIELIKTQIKLDASKLDINFNEQEG